MTIPQGDTTMSWEGPLKPADPFQDILDRAKSIATEKWNATTRNDPAKRFNDLYAREAARLATQAERGRLKEKLDAAERLAEAVGAIIKEAAEDEGLDQAYFAGDDLVDALAAFRDAGKKTP